MAVYETAFDSVPTPTSEAEDDPSDDLLELSRQLCSPEPSLRPSPASSRSSRSSTCSGTRKSTRSPGLPLKKIFGQWVCAKEHTSTEPQLENPPKNSTDHKEQKCDTFSPSVEFKKLEVAGSWNLNDMPPVHSEVSSVLRFKEYFSSGNLMKSHQIGNYNSNESRQNLNKPSSYENRLHHDSQNVNVLQCPSKTHHIHRDLKEDMKKTNIRLNSDKSGTLDNRLHNDLENSNILLSSADTHLPHRDSRDDMKRTSIDPNSGGRENLWLDFSRASKRPRRHLFLDLGKSTNDVDTEPTAQLLKQEWYHGSISRTDAENMLRMMKKGSFLVRASEKLQRQYLLSLKSSLGVVHVKIVQSLNGKYVIKQQAQSFDSIPQLVQYFSTHILHIHEMNVYLTHPVIEKLL